QTLVAIASIIALIFVFNGCKKDVSSNQFPEQSLLIKQVSAWLNTQQSSANSSIAPRISELQKYLNYGGIRTEQLRNNEHFIVIPINTGLKTVAQLKSAVNSLVLIVN